MIQKLAFKKVLLLCLLSLLLGCRPTDVIEIGYELEVFVTDATDIGVEGATVTLYATAEDFRADVNPVRKETTNRRGYVIFKGLDLKTFRYFVSVERGNENNWEDKTQVVFSRLEQQSHTLKVKIKSSIANTIAGRYEKRWRQVNRLINNTPDNSCFSRQVHAFRRDWFVKIFAGNGCPNAGLEVSGDVWAVTSDNRGIIRGTPGGPSERRLTILELTDKRLVYSETLGPTFSIIETFEIVE
jgi:hypothetical protein